jgi:hypothetical protein
VVWNEKRSSTGSHTFTAGPSSTFGVCFSNKMSSMAHKTVYFDFVVGNDDPVQAAALQHHETFTQLETSMINTHDAMRRALDLQTHHRMREATHRYTAEYMNDRVQLVSACEVTRTPPSLHLIPHTSHRPLWTLPRPRGRPTKACGYNSTPCVPSQHQCSPNTYRVSTLLTLPSYTNDVDLCRHSC